MKTHLTWPVLVLALGRAALAEGPQLPDGAKKVAEHRYRVSTDLEATLKYFKAVYSPEKFPRKQLVNQPGIHAIHLANPSGKDGWEGLNIYEANGEVRIFVVATDEAAQPAAAKKAAGSQKPKR